MGKISVCMATYNGAKYNKEQLESILCQLSEDDEVIVSDDGSTDGTIDIIMSYHDNRVKVLHHISSPGSSFVKATRNFENALLHAHGDYIFLADQDDVWHKNKVSVCSSYLDKYMLIQHDQTLIGNSYGYPLHVKSIHKLFFLNLFDLPFKGCCMAFRRELLQKVLPIPKPVIVHDAWIGCWGYLSGSYVSINDELIDYRVHGKNVSVGTRNRLYYKILYRLQICYCLFKRSFF